MRGVRRIMMVVVAVAVSGCLQEEPGLASDEPPRRMTFDWALADPVIVNETTDDVVLEWVPRDSCMFQPRPHIFIKVLDRDGVALEQVRTLPSLTESASFSVDFPGEPPWLVFGHNNPCQSPGDSTWSGIRDGFATRRAKYWAMHQDDATLLEERLEIPLRAGDTGTFATWAGDPLTTWNTFGVVLDVERGVTGFAGSIRTYYPDGVLWREDTYSLTGAYDTFFEPMQYYPGEYRIEVEATKAASKDMTIGYTVLYSAIDANACAEGFQWPELCT